MASAINYDTVWSSIFEPAPTYGFLERYGCLGEQAGRHDLPYHVLGSDLAGVVLRTGPGVNRWRPGDRVVAHCLSVELESSDGHDDTMLDPEQRIRVFETNFGGLAELALVKSNQLRCGPSWRSPGERTRSVWSARRRRRPSAAPWEPKRSSTAAPRTTGSGRTRPHR